MKSDSIRTTRTRELPRTTQLPFYQYYIYAKSDGKRLMTSAVAITPEISQITLPWVALYQYFCLFIYLFTDLIQFYLLYTAVIFFFNVKRKNTIKYNKNVKIKKKKYPDVY